MNMHKTPACHAGCAAALLLLFMMPATGADGDEAKEQKFKELEQRHQDAPGRLSLTKAKWLTERGNSRGEQGDLDRAITDLREAIDIKQDYIPAYISLALAYRAGERYGEALEVIEKAPTRMKLGDTELGGFEYDLYYLRMLVYAAIPDHEQGIAAAREGIRVLDDPAIQEQRRRAEQAGVAGAGSGSRIVGFLERYVRVQESRRGN